MPYLSSYNEKLISKLIGCFSITKKAENYILLSLQALL